MNTIPPLKSSAIAGAIDGTDCQFVKDEDYKRELGAALTRAIEASGVTKTDIAAAVGKQWQTVNTWFNGKHKPSPAELAIIAKLTNDDSLLAIGKPRGPRLVAVSSDPALAAVQSSTEYQMAEPWMREALEWFRDQAPLPDDAVVDEEAYQRLLFAMQAIKGENKE